MTNQDKEHLRLLSIFHYVVAGLTFLIGCIPMIHLGMGLAMVYAPHVFQGKGSPPPPFMGYMFAAIGALAILFCWSVAGAVVYAGRCLSARRKYLFCLVMAAIQCMFMPFGTVLGVFTIIVLMRPTVKELFGVTAAG